MSNLVAEELQSALEAKGIQLDESAFEERVSDIVSAINEAVEDDDIEKEPVTEDDKFYMATKPGQVGGKDVAEGEYVEFEDTDDGKKATIYDEDGNIKESDIPVKDDEAEAFASEAEELEEGEGDDVDEGADCEDCDEVDEEVDENTEEEEIADDDEDEEDVEEAKVHIKGGKKVKMTKSELRKKKAIAQGKKREGMKWDGKRFVKMSAQEKKRAKLWAKKMHKGSAAAHAKKSHKKAQKIAAGSTSGTVTEAFDIHSDAVTFTAEAGDVIVMNEGVITVIREGKEVLKGLSVSEGFFDRCYEAKVLEAAGEEEEKKTDECGDAKECGDAGSDEEKTNEGDEGEGSKEEEKTDEASILTFKADKGYVLVKEGKELPMGNRVRARATLVSEGFNISSAQLDAASKGEMVTL